MQPNHVSYNSHFPSSSGEYGRDHSPSQQFIPAGAPMQGGYGYSPQQYTFVPGIGFVRRSPEDDERAQIARSSRQLAFAMIACLGLMYLVYPFASLLTSLVTGLLRIVPSPAASALSSNTISYVVALSIPFMVYQSRVGIPIKAAYPLKRPRTWLVLCGTLIFLGVCTIGDAASDMLDTLLRTGGLYARSSNAVMPSDTLGAVLHVLLYALLAPILEELVFRGVIMQSLRRFGDALALVCSSVLFALIHADILTLPYAFLSGLVIGYFVLRSGSLLTGMIIHFANNLFWIIYDAAATGLSPTQGDIVLHSIYTAFIIAGLFAAVFAAKRDAAMFSLAPGSTALPYKLKIRTMFTSGLMIVFIIIVLGLMLGNISTSSMPW